MSEEWDGSRRIIWAQDLDDMEVIGTHMFSVGVPVDADPEFKTYVFAAGVTHSMGNKSIDYQLKRNYANWIHRHSPEVLLAKGSLNALLRNIRDLVNTRCAAISDLSLGPSPSDALSMASNALIRLESTFRAAAQLVRLQFPFEAEAVVRLGFEQIGWAFSISDLLSVEQVVATKPTSGTTRLKEIFPGAGRIYGRLSNLAHMALHTQARVMAADDDDQLRIEIKSPEAIRESALLLIILLDAFLAVTDKCFGPVGLEYSTLDTSDATLRSDRPAVRLLRTYESLLATDASKIFDQWWNPRAI